MFDDAVVGAGIVGLAHAYHLARRGRRVVVIERNPMACGASVRNFGMLWPIGQPPGPMLQMARRSLKHWETVLKASGLWHDRVGSLHLAYAADEASVLSEFAGDSERFGYSCRLVSPNEARSISPMVGDQGLVSALYSDTEMCVDPRQVIAGLPAWLSREYGVTFLFGAAATSYDDKCVVVGGKSYRTGRLWVCGGDDFRTLYPEVFCESGLFLCKLQMMRTAPTNAGEGVHRLGPMLAGGLTLGHYKAFERCPSLPALKARFRTTMPQYERYGIHVMASQNGLGEIVIGDSHEYGPSVDPFDKVEIDRLILEYLKRFLDFTGLEIAQRWHGVYAKHPVDPYFTAEPEAGVMVVTGVGGAGMTFSFGLADQIVTSVLG